MRHQLVFLTLSSLLAAAAGCSGGTANAPAGPEVSADGVEAFVAASEETGADGTTRIDFADGRQFQITEVAPGAVLVDETGPARVVPTARRVNLRNLSPLEMFRTILPNARPPTSLVSVNERVLLAQAQPQAHVQRTTQDTEVDPSEVEQPQQASPLEDLTPKAIDDSLCPADWFTDSLCITLGLDVGDWYPTAQRWATCKTYQTRNGNFQRNDTVTGESVTCVYQGSVHYRVRTQPWYTWKTALEVDVPEGFWHWQRSVADTVDFDYEVHNTPNSGSGYHYSGFSDGALRVFPTPPYD